MELDEIEVEYGGFDWAYREIPWSRSASAVWSVGSDGGFCRGLLGPIGVGQIGLDWPCHIL